MADVLPVFNRFVVFATTDFSYHGHPDPLACPSDRTRRSLALYYYANGRPAEERSSQHSTVYGSQPGESQGRARRAVERVTPPVLLDAARNVHRRAHSR